MYRWAQYPRIYFVSLGVTLDSAETPPFSWFLTTILAEIITKQFLGTFSFVMIFVIITKIIPPEDFLCNVAATDVSLFGRKQAKGFAL